MFNAAILSARPTGEALDLGPALVSDRPDMPRFHLWQGRSRGRYLVAVHEIGEIDLPDDSVVLLVAAGCSGRREILAALAFGTVDRAAERRLQAAVQVCGATEVHVHLLARTAADRAAALRDLAPARCARGTGEAERAA
jgi:hypothetical protein